MASSSHTWRLLIPREHGSWGLWLLPLMSAAMVALYSKGGSAAALMWFLLTAAAAFMIYQPLEELLGLSLFRIRTSEEKRVALLWTAGFAVLALIGLAVLTLRLHREKLVWIVALAATCFGLRAALGVKRSYRVLKELIGSLALSSSALGAYYCITDAMDKSAWGLWLAAWLFAVAQIEYVQMRIGTSTQQSAVSIQPKKHPSDDLGTGAGGKEKRHQSRFFWVLGFHFALPVLALGAWSLGLAPALLAVAFLPSLVKVLIWRLAPHRKLRVHRLGVSELLHSIAFSALLTGVYLYPRWLSGYG